VQLSLSAHSFWRFGETFGAMFDAGCDPIEAGWEWLKNQGKTQKLMHFELKQQAKHQGLEAEVLGDQLHDARIRLEKKTGVFIDPDESAWDAISTLYGKQTQLEEGLAAGVDQLISHCVSVLSANVDNDIRMKVDASLGPL
jgi:hypothetical protein